HVRLIAAGTPQRDHADFIIEGRSTLYRLLSVASRVEGLSAERCRELLLRVLDGKAVSADILSRRRDVLLPARDGTARALAAQLTLLRSRLANLRLQGPGKLTPEQYRARCADLERQTDEAERALALRVRAFADLQQAQNASLEALAARLEPGEVLVE